LFPEEMGNVTQEMADAIANELYDLPSSPLSLSDSSSVSVKSKKENIESGQLAAFPKNDNEFSTMPLESTHAISPSYNKTSLLHSPAESFSANEDGFIYKIGKKYQNNSNAMGNEINDLSMRNDNNVTHRPLYMLGQGARAKSRDHVSAISESKKLNTRKVHEMQPDDNEDFVPIVDNKANSHTNHGCKCIEVNAHRYNVISNKLDTIMDKIVDIEERIDLRTQTTHDIISTNHHDVQTALFDTASTLRTLCELLQRREGKSDATDISSIDKTLKTFSETLQLQTKETITEFYTSLTQLFTDSRTFVADQVQISFESLNANSQNSRDAISTKLDEIHLALNTSANTKSYGKPNVNSVGNPDEDPITPSRPPKRAIFDSVPLPTPRSARTSDRIHASNISNGLFTDRADIGRRVEINDNDPLLDDNLADKRVQKFYLQPPKLDEYPTYDMNLDSDHRLWMDQIDRMRESRRIPDVEIVSRLGSILKGAAKTWYDVAINSLGNATWAQWKQEIVDKAESNEWRMHQVHKRDAFNFPDVVPSDQLQAGSWWAWELLKISSSISPGLNLQEFQAIVTTRMKSDSVRQSLNLLEYSKPATTIADYIKSIGIASEGRKGAARPTGDKVITTSVKVVEPRTAFADRRRPFSSFRNNNRPEHPKAEVQVKTYPSSGNVNNSFKNNSKPIGTANNKIVTCYNCNKTGHYARDCPDSRTGPTHRVIAALDAVGSSRQVEDLLDEGADPEDGDTEGEPEVRNAEVEEADVAGLGFAYSDEENN